MSRVLIFTFLLIASSASSQSLRDVSRSKQITWYGIDQSMLRLFGFENSEKQKLVSEVLPAIDFTPLNDEDLAKLNRWFKKRISSSNTSGTESRNASVSAQNAFVDEIDYLDFEDIENAVKNLKLTGKGFGLIVFAESMDNKTRKASCWIVYLDEASGKIIHAMRYKELCDNPFGAASQIFIWKSAIEANLKNAGFDLKVAKRY